MAKPGDRVEITGIYRAQPVKVIHLSSFPFIVCRFFVYMYPVCNSCNGMCLHSLAHTKPETSSTPPQPSVRYSFSRRPKGGEAKHKLQPQACGNNYVSPRFCGAWPFNQAKASLLWVVLCKHLKLPWQPLGEAKWN